MATLSKGKYRIQVSLSEEEYQKLRQYAFDLDITVNELLRIVTLNAAEEYIKGQ